MILRCAFSISFIFAAVNLMIWKDVGRAIFCLLLFIAIALVEIYDKENKKE